jgi:hypothetical protein
VQKTTSAIDSPRVSARCSGLTYVEIGVLKGSSYGRRRWNSYDNLSGGAQSQRSEPIKILRLDIGYLVQCSQKFPAVSTSCSLLQLTLAHWPCAIIGIGNAKMVTIVTPQDELRIGESFADLIEVEKVYVVRSGDIFRVYTIVGDLDEDGYDRIYERERSIMRDYKSICPSCGQPKPLHFDFNVISRRGRDAEEIVNSLTPAWQRTPL